MDEHRRIGLEAGTAVGIDRGGARLRRRGLGQLRRVGIPRPAPAPVDPDEETRLVPIVSTRGAARGRRMPLLAVGAMAVSAALSAGWLLERADAPSLAAAAVTSPSPSLAAPPQTPTPRRAPAATPVVRLARAIPTPAPRPVTRIVVRPDHHPDHGPGRPGGVSERLYGHR